MIRFHRTRQIQTWATLCMMTRRGPAQPTFSRLPRDLPRTREADPNRGMWSKLTYCTSYSSNQNLDSPNVTEVETNKICYCLFSGLKPGLGTVSTFSSPLRTWCPQGSPIPRAWPRVVKTTSLQLAQSGLSLNLAPLRKSSFFSFLKILYLDITKAAAWKSQKLRARY